MVDKVVETGVLSEIFEQRSKHVVETVGGQNVIVRLGFKRRILDVFARTGIEYVGNVVDVIIPGVAFVCGRVGRACVDFLDHFRIGVRNGKFFIEDRRRFRYVLFKRPVRVAVQEIAAAGDCLGTGKFNLTVNAEFCVFVVSYKKVDSVVDAENIVVRKKSVGIERVRTLFDDIGENVGIVGGYVYYFIIAVVEIQFKIGSSV